MNNTVMTPEMEKEFQILKELETVNKEIIAAQKERIRYLEKAIVKAIVSLANASVRASSGGESP